MYTLSKLATLALPFTIVSAYRIPRTPDVHARASLNNTLASTVNSVAGIVPSVVNSQSLLDSTLANIRKQGFEISVLEETFAGLLQAVVASSTPASISDALTQIAQTVNGTNSTIENVAELILNGLAVTDLTQNVLAGYLSGINSFNNTNPPPPTTIYPQKSARDAPYSVPESQLRAAIYIPPGFTYGQKRPILFVPGTGAYGGVNFISNLGKLLGNDGRFDPVYLNVPGAMLDDAQINSEYIAYAINYLGSITGTSQNANNLAVIPWSQGNLDTQWVFQYWPSTRPVVTDFISASADFHGTVLAYLLDPALINPPNPPSIIQQEYDSNFVLTLRYGGGGSPYVNSTSVHSISDEIVQPQYSPYASADYFTQDLPGTPNTSPKCPIPQNVQYTNNQIQTVCAGYPAGGPYYTHEGVLYHPLMYALTLDALTHDGPGRIDRIDIPTVCSQLVAPGLSLTDVLATEGLIPLALVNILLYPNKVQNEPAIRQYALQANAQCNANSTTTTTTTTTSASTTTSTKTTTTTASTTKTTSSSATTTTMSGTRTPSATTGTTTTSSRTTKSTTTSSTSTRTPITTSTTKTSNPSSNGPMTTSHTSTSTGKWPVNDPAATTSTASHTDFGGPGSDPGNTGTASPTSTYSHTSFNTAYPSPSDHLHAMTTTSESLFAHGTVTTVSSGMAQPTTGFPFDEETVTVTSTSTQTVTADCGCNSGTTTASSAAATSTSSQGWGQW